MVHYSLDHELLRSLVDALVLVGSLPLEFVAEASGLLCRDLLLSPVYNTYITNHGP